MINLENKGNDINSVMTKKILLCCIFFLFSPVIIFSVFFFTDYFKSGMVLGQSVSVSPQASNMYSYLFNDSKVFLPSIKGENSVLVIVEKYLERYKSPLLPYALEIVLTAEKYEVDPKLILAIAQQESNLGKNSLADCNNAWGWGIHSKGTKCFILSVYILIPSFK